MRYVTKEAINGLVVKLGFPSPYLHQQDWEYTVGDGTRVSEWIAEYQKRTDLTDEERFALMIIIIQSFDDALSVGIADDQDWERIENALRLDSSLHQATLEYWSMSDEEDPDNDFYVTPRVRKILEELKSDRQS